MKFVFLLIISSTSIPYSMAANAFAKTLKEKLNFGTKDCTKIQRAMQEPIESIKAAIERASNSELKEMNKEGMNAAHAAAALGRTDVLELLHAKNEELILKENNEGNKAIHVAAMCGEADVVKFLVNVANVEVDVKSGKKKMTSLQLAAESGCVDVIKALVELKADINACDINENTLTPLAYAVTEAHFEATKTLLELGADKEKQIRSVPYSTRPLPIAVYKLNIEIAELLLSQNVDTMYDDFTIVHYLSEAPSVGDGGKKVEAMFDVLIEKPVRQNGVDTGKPMHSYLGGERNIIHHTMSKRNYEMFHVLVRKINEEWRPGRTERILTELLDDKDARGHNALGMAVEKWDKEMTFTLMRTEALRVGAANFYMNVWESQTIMAWFSLIGWPILELEQQHSMQPENFLHFCETYLKKYGVTWVDAPEGIATDLSSLFPRYKSRNIYPFYLALQSYYSVYIDSYFKYGEIERKELAEKLFEEYRNHGKRKKEYLFRNEEDGIKYLISSKENEYMMEDRIRFANSLKEIYVWRPELEEDAFILAHLKTKFQFNSDDVKALFSEDGKK